MNNKDIFKISESADQGPQSNLRKSRFYYGHFLHKYYPISYIPQFILTIL